MTQLYLPEYRGTGLLEHVHVSTFYVAIGILAGVTLYLKSGTIRYLIVAGFCEAVLIMHGVRFALVAGITAIVVNLILNGWNARVHNSWAQMRARLKLSAVLLLSVFVIVLLADPFGTVSKYYIPVLTQGQGAWTLDPSSDVTPGLLIRQALANMFITQISGLANIGLNRESFDILFGHGIARSLIGDVAGLSDDFFLVQIFSQYGLLGGLVFYLLLFYTLVQGLRASAVRSADESNLLLVAFSVAVVFLLASSTLHSGVLQRKVTFAVLFWVTAIIFSFSARRSTAKDDTASEG